jgi:phosphoenolpyruvate-protein kinase (PTS system EI component)
MYCPKCEAEMPSVLRTGLRSLSVPASLVPDVKNAIRNLCSKDLVVRMN